MTTYYQELFSTNKMNIHMEYNNDGSVRAVYYTPNRKLPEQLYSAIPLPSIHATTREVWYWIRKAQAESSHILYYVK